MENQEEEQSSTFKNTFSYKLIYVFAIADDAHAGSVKIGDTKLDTDLTQDRLQPNCRELNQAAISRINTYTKTAGVIVSLLHTEQFRKKMEVGIQKVSEIMMFIEF